MTSTFIVKTDQCLLCNNQIHKELGSLRGVFGVEMDRIEGKITVSHTEEVSREEIKKIIESVGFIETKEK